MKNTHRALLATSALLFAVSCELPGPAPGGKSFATLTLLVDS